MESCLSQKSQLTSLHYYHQPLQCLSNQPFKNLTVLPAIIARNLSHPNKLITERASTLFFRRVLITPATPRLASSTTDLHRSTEDTISSRQKSSSRPRRRPSGSLDLADAPSKKCRFRTHAGRKLIFLNDVLSASRCTSIGGW